MQKLKYHETGIKNDRWASGKNIKGHPFNSFPDSKTRDEIGFDDLETSVRYDHIPEIKKEEILEKAINEITHELDIFNYKGWNLALKNRVGNFITLEYRSTNKFTEAELLELEQDLSDHLEKSFFDNKMYRLQIDDKQIRDGILRLLFRIRNSGFYSMPKLKDPDDDIKIQNPENVLTNSKEDQTEDNNNKKGNESEIIQDQASDQAQSNKDQTKSLIERKALRIPKSALKAWNPKSIRNFIDSKEYESSRLFDRSSTIKRGSNKDQTILKTIWLTKEQARKWIPERIKLFLLSKVSNDLSPEIKESSYNYEKGFTILINLFNAFMVNIPEFKQKIISYGEEHEKEFEQLKEDINKLNGGVNND